mmetsp:Transcript_169/g.221  ORF Transcript_169/g.221 Transcript_169/m.221 type:complete len:226 (-) Transcript_169:812-1489(-)
MMRIAEMVGIGLDAEGRNGHNDRNQGKEEGKNVGKDVNVDPTARNQGPKPCNCHGKGGADGPCQCCKDSVSSKGTHFGFGCKCLRGTCLQVNSVRFAFLVVCREFIVHTQCKQECIQTCLLNPFRIAILEQMDEPERGDTILLLDAGTLGQERRLIGSRHNTRHRLIAQRIKFDCPLVGLPNDGCRTNHLSVCRKRMSNPAFALIHENTRQSFLSNTVVQGHIWR